MSLGRREIGAISLTVGLVAGATGAYFAGEKLGDDRAPQPNDLVCTTEIRQGESPHTLAEEATFSGGPETVLGRSQFINPEAVLSYASGDEGHFVGDFNVMRQSGLEAATVPGQQIYIGGICVRGVAGLPELDSGPELPATSRILRGTVAFKEATQREFGGGIRYRRCGGVAITDTVVLLPAADRMSEDTACLDTGTAETWDGVVVNATNVSKYDGWRYVDLGGSLVEPVEVDVNYEPQVGETLVYSGYDRGGTRQYLRVLVAGHDNDTMVVRAGVDVINAGYLVDGIDPSALIRSGGGGIFNLDGKLVGMTTSGYRYQSTIGGSYSERRSELIRQHNAELTEWLESLGYVQAEKRDGEQYVGVQLLRSVAIGSVSED